jgi:quercetin dioxygenase-like cupin family protein
LASWQRRVRIGGEEVTLARHTCVDEERRTGMTMRLNRICVLLIMLAAAAAVGEPVPSHAADTDKVIVLSAQKLKFTSIPDMPGCASAAILRGNPRWGAAWVLLKLDSGCRVPLHWHTPNEDLVVISGQGTLSMKDGPSLQFAPGAYTSLPSHHMHQASCTRSCLFFNSADGAFDIHYVDANGEEISADQALKPPAKKPPAKKQPPKKQRTKK